MDTSNILFVGGGTFEGIEEHIAGRIGKKRMGFGGEGKEEDLLRNRAKLLKHVDTDDLLKFGMIPELIGRFPIISFLEPLDEEAYVSILTEPRNSIVKQYRKLMELEGFKLAFTREALKAIAKRAIAKGTGARGLRSVVEEVMLDVMYEAPSRKDITEITISAEMIEKGVRLPEPKPITTTETLPPPSEQEPRRESA